MYLYPTLLLYNYTYTKNICLFQIKINFSPVFLRMYFKLHCFASMVSADCEHIHFKDAFWDRPWSDAQNHKDML